MKKFLLLFLSIGILAGCKSNESDKSNDNDKISHSDFVGTWRVNIAPNEQILFTLNDDGTGERRYFSGETMTDANEIEDWYVKDDKLIIITSEYDGTSHIFETTIKDMADNGKTINCITDHDKKIQFEKMR